MFYTSFEWSNHCQKFNKIHWRELPVCTWYVIYFWNQFHPLISSPYVIQISVAIFNRASLVNKKKSAFESSNQNSARESFETVQHITRIREKCRVVVNNLCLFVDPYRDKTVSYLLDQEITWRQYTCVVWYLVFGWSARCAKGFFWTT